MFYCFPEILASFNNIAHAWVDVQSTCSDSKQLNKTKRQECGANNKASVPSAIRFVEAERECWYSTQVALFNISKNNQKFKDVGINKL